MSSPQFIKPYPNGYIDGEIGNTPVTAEIFNTNYDAFLLALNEFLPELEGMVEANPSEAATAGNLTKLKVGNSIYLVPSGGSGGSTVEWEQIQLTGTKIATITIDNVPVDVYAPSGGGSGDEVSWNQVLGSGTEIGTITINDTPITVYAPTPIDVEANPSGSASAGDLTKLKIGSSIYSIPSGGSGGASDLSDLDDVTITNVQNGQIIKWNSTTSKWENANESGGGIGGSWTDVTGTLTAGQTSITLSNGNITIDSTIDFYTTIFGVNPTAVSVSTGSVTLTFEAQSSDLGVKIRVTNDALVQYNLIPRMSGNTDTTGTASASYVYFGRYAYYGFTTDGNGNPGTASSFWYNKATSSYLQYVFNTAKHISKIGFGALESSSINLTFKFQFTTDGINWTDGDTNTIASNDWTWYELSDTVECLGFRIYCIDNISTLSGVQAYGWE